MVALLQRDRSVGAESRDECVVAAHGRDRGSAELQRSGERAAGESWTAADWDFRPADIYEPITFLAKIERSSYEATLAPDGTTVVDKETIQLSQLKPKLIALHAKDTERALMLGDFYPEHGHAKEAPAGFKS